MNNNENALSLLFYLLSYVVAIVGGFLGVFFIINENDLGIVVIIFAIINGIILFGLSKVLQLLEEIKRNYMLPSPEITIIKEVEQAEGKAEVTKEKNVENSTPFNEPVEWTLTEIQKANILTYYMKDNQRVVESNIIKSPYKGYCVVKTNSFIDVIELVDDHPITLNRAQVESFKELNQWIQNSVFHKKKK